MVISKVRWLARSPDLTLPDFLRGYLKKNVYWRKPRTAEALKEAYFILFKSTQIRTLLHQSFLIQNSIKFPQRF